MLQVPEPAFDFLEARNDVKIRKWSFVQSIEFSDQTARPRIPARPRSATGSMPCNSKPYCVIARTARLKHQAQATSGRSTSARPKTRPSGRETPRRGQNCLGDKVRRIDRDARHKRSATAEKQHRAPSPGGGGQTSPHSKLCED
jgi:hypothetical protein